MLKRIDTQVYIERARKGHGDRYNYSRTKYTTMHDKVQIGCPEHGYFEQNARNHLRGSGCSACGGSMRLDTKSFIQRSREAHGNKYDYSAVTYRRSADRVTIICSIHGEFEQFAQHHIRGIGCRKCRDDNARKTTKTFVREAREVHGDKYDYTEVQYERSSKKVTINCPIHGGFEQTPASHLSGRGCIDCAGLRQLTTDDFAAFAKRVHGEKYDYSRVNYINNYTNVTISCPTHGAFSQRPSGHLFGYGCQECGADRQLEHVRKDKAWFIKRAKQVHGDRYDYSLVEYSNLKSDVDIICPTHGAFITVAETHLRGHQCKFCAGIVKNTEMFISDAQKVHAFRYDYSLTDYAGSGSKVVW